MNLDQPALDVVHEAVQALESVLKSPTISDREIKVLIDAAASLRTLHALYDLPEDRPHPQNQPKRKFLGFEIGD